MTDNLVEFPRHGGKTPADQMGAVSDITCGMALAALAMKYPDIRLTADELDAARTWKPGMRFDHAANSWAPYAKRRATS